MTHESAYYRICDNPEYFKFKISFGLVKSAFQSAKKSEVATEMYTFHWQEKVFSELEKEKYAELSNCTTELERLYHRRVKDIAKRETRNYFSLFTYINEDPELKSFQESKGQSHLASSLVTKLSINPELESAMSDQPLITSANPVIYRPTTTQRINNHFPRGIIKRMCILAELNERGSIEKPSAQKHSREELLLCTIDLDEHGALRVNPDFTKADEKHKITNNSGKAVFEYIFENCSEDMSDTEKQKEEFNLFEYNRQRVGRLLSAVGTNFETPCDGWLRIYLRGEIVSARGFEYDKLCVQYFLELPSGWKSSSSAALSGCTQLASFVETTQGAFAYFSFPLEFDIAFAEEVYADKNANKTLKWPTLFMEILSMDIFTRCRTEGYAYTALPRCSGTHLIEVSAWRPVGQSIVSRLRRFFVGGTPQLEDATFAMIPSDFQGSKLSKYGFRTDGAGSLFLRFYAIQQCWEFMEKQRPPLLRRLIVDKFAVDSHRLETLTAIKMYQEARKKLLQARRGVQKQMELYA